MPRVLLVGWDGADWRIRDPLLAEGRLPDRASLIDRGPKGQAFTHPSTLADELVKAGAPWPINGMSWTTYRNRPDSFLDEVNAVTRARIKAMDRLADSDWDLGCFVFFATDRIQHCLSEY